MYTFKAQAKSNAKRFLVQTAKVDNFEEYLTQDGDGNWGTYLDETGKPAKFADVLAAIEARKEETCAPAPAPSPASATEEPAPFPDAFGAFAVAQLTAASPTLPAATPSAARPAREGATPTAGLKIQKDRPEQNGIRRQSAGSVGDKLWALYDQAGPEVTLEQAKALAEAAGLSKTSAAIALYNWRKFHGIASRPTGAK